MEILIFWPRLVVYMIIKNLCPIIANKGSNSVQNSLYASMFDRSFANSTIAILRSHM